MVLGIGTEEGGPVKIGSGEYLTDGSGAAFRHGSMSTLKELSRPPLRRWRRSPWMMATSTGSSGAYKTSFAQRTEEVYPLARYGLVPDHRGRDPGSRSPSAGVRASVGSGRRVAPVVRHVGRGEAADFVDMWLTPDQQDRRAFSRGDYPPRRHFAEPQWRGVSLYRAGRYQDAIDAFAQSTAPESYFNQRATP